MTQEKQRHTIIFVTNSFSSDSGGRTASIFTRAKMFQEMGHRICIATRNIKPGYLGIFRSLCKKHGLAGADFANFYSFLAQEEIFGYGPAGNPDSELVDETEEDESSDIIIRRRKDLSGNVYYTKRASIDGRNIGADFQTPEGRTYLVFLPNEKGQQQRRAWIQKDGTVRNFDSLKSLWSYWIAALAEKYENPLFFLEERGTDAAVLDNPYWEHPAPTVATLHGTIFGAPNTYGSPLSPYAQKLLERIEDYSAVVILTNQERAHICNYYGEHQNLYCITHPQQIVTPAETPAKRPYTIVMCTRLTPLKRIDDAIRAVAKAHRQIPQLKLEIFGSGPEGDTLQGLIRENEAEGFIEIKGYTAQPLEAVASASLSLSTSLYEGLGLSTFEALMMGTPVLAYDYLYGPRFFIKNKVNGMIVPNGDIDALARAIVELFNDPERLARMSAAARELDPKLLPSAIESQWENLFDRIDAQEPRRALAEQFSVAYEARALSSHTEKVHGGTFTWSVEVEFLIDSDIEPTRYFLFFDSCQRIDIRDRLYIQGEPSGSDGNKRRATFSLTAPQNELKALLVDKRHLRVEVEFGCHAEILPLTLNQEES